MSRVTFALVIIASLAASAFACESAQSLIEQAEGYRACEYVDTNGHPTICYGFNLDKADAASEIASVGGDYSKVRAGGCLSQSQCTQLLQMDMQSAISGEEQVFGSGVCYCVTQVLIDMTYNLGVSGISSFTTFRSYIEAGEWAKAAADARGTLWCSQVGSRCTRDTSIIAAGC